jgi:hypothetical protein
MGPLTPATLASRSPPLFLKLLHVQSVHVIDRTPYVSGASLLDETQHSVIRRLIQAIGVDKSKRLRP